MKKKLLTMIKIVICVLMVLFYLTGCDKRVYKDKVDSVIIAISSEPTSLDPCMGWGHGTTPLIQSTLVEYLQDMTFRNDLATEYEISEDGLTWTFQIREDAYFTDGVQVKASDVVFTFLTAKKVSPP